MYLLISKQEFPVVVSAVLVSHNFPDFLHFVCVTASRKKIERGNLGSLPGLISGPSTKVEICHYPGNLDVKKNHCYLQLTHSKQTRITGTI